MRVLVIAFVLPGLMSAALWTGWPAASRDGRPGLSLTSCHLERLGEEVLCGVVEVPEDRAYGSNGRRLSIHVTVLPALRRSARPDPLFLMAGGPGQSARDAAGLVARSFKAIRRTRAIVLVDLRGTGDSHPLTCLAGQDEVAALARGADLFFGRAAECLNDLDADPRYYTHADALADLDEVRQRLGYAQINLWGGSWGTRAALLYALRFPAAVRRVILDGAVPLGMGFPAGVTATTQQAFDRLVVRCAMQPECARTFPDPRQELEVLLDSVGHSPASANLRHPRTGARVDVTISREVAEEIVRVAMYTTVDAARIFNLVRRAGQGDYEPLLAQLVHSAGSIDEMALGSTMAILCSEDVPRVQSADLGASRDRLFGSSYAQAWIARCHDWPVGAPLDLEADSSSAAPALILSGIFDPVTPPPTGAAMARAFPRHHHLIVESAAHNVSFTGCVPEILAAFLEEQALDDRCIRDAPMPAIALTEAQP